MTLGNWIDAFERDAQIHWKQRPSWWCLLAVWTFPLLAVGLIYQARVDHALAARQNTILGVLESRDPANHNCFRYSFSVKAHSYRGCGPPSETSARIGDSVLVYYDPLDPTANSLSSFQDRSGAELGFLAAPILFTFAAVFYIAWRRRRAVREGLDEDLHRGSQA